MFELESSGVTKSAVEVRYPFLDLRVVEYFLALPPFPWFFEKTLLREAMAGRVLDKVRSRPKTPFSADPLLEHLRRFGPFETIPASKGLNAGGLNVGGLDLGSSNPAGSRSDHLLSGGAPPDRHSAALFGQYINASLLVPLHAKMTAEQVSQNARPFCFNFWLQCVR